MKLTHELGCEAVEEPVLEVEAPEGVDAGEVTEEVEEPLEGAEVELSDAAEVEEKSGEPAMQLSVAIASF